MVSGSGSSRLVKYLKSATAAQTKANPNELQSAITLQVRCKLHSQQRASNL
jgi:hypothetical protein